MDITTEHEANQTPGQMPMHSSIHLAEKLKKLMETPASTTNPMECDLDDKKQTHATVVKEGIQNLTSSASVEAKKLPAIKHSHNGATPPPIAKNAC